jgi:protein arginine kinase activator
MLCSECKINQATVHITKIVNGVKKEMHICSECAKKLESLGGFKFINQSDFLIPLFNFGGEEIKSKGRICPSCGTRLSDFNDSGYLGCAQCYTEFADYLQPVIKRVQRGLKHIGKTPQGEGKNSVDWEYEKLTAELKAAVAEERYEDAAAIRDKLRKIR